MKLLTIVGILIIPLCIYFFAFDSMMYDISFHKSILNPEAVETTKELIAYYSNNEWNAPAIPEFTVQENSHLLDVKKVLLKLDYLKIILFTVLAFALAYGDRRRILFYGSILALLVPLLSFLSFNMLFDTMHRAFFEGNWTFGLESVMLKYYPQEYFAQFALVLAGRAASLSVIILMALRKSSK